MKMWRKPLDWEENPTPSANVYIIENRCKGCGLCVEFCPRNVLKISDAFNKKGYHPPEVLAPDGCVNCHYCEIICPEFAIYSVADPQH